MCPVDLLPINEPSAEQTAKSNGNVSFIIDFEHWQMLQALDK